ncbi:MAG: metallophosphoesterase [Crenarchaeota archaeon]|nr:metallophosphoesterase [Thermoproteota archaeon]
MRILATADIHSPKYLKKFERLLNTYKLEIENIDIVLIAGDLMEKGNLNGLRQLVEVLRRFTDAPVYACPGNEDYDESVEKAKNLIRDVKWIIDEKISINVKGITVNIVGSKGVLDKPTFWQLRHVKNIREIYENRLKLLSELVDSLGENELNILLLHYAPTYATLEGENRRIWCFLGTSRLEKKISEKKLLVVHGHAHRSKRRIVRLGRSIVINASFPEIFDLYMIEIVDKEVTIDVLKSSGEKVRALQEEEKRMEKRGTSILDYV